MIIKLNFLKFEEQIESFKIILETNWWLVQYVLKNMFHYFLLVQYLHLLGNEGLSVNMISDDNRGEKQRTMRITCQNGVFHKGRQHSKRQQ